MHVQFQKSCKKEKMQKKATKNFSNSKNIYKKSHAKKGRGVNSVTDTYLMCFFYQKNSKMKAKKADRVYTFLSFF